MDKLIVNFETNVSSERSLRVGSVTTNDSYFAFISIEKIEHDKLGWRIEQESQKWLIY